MFRDRHYGSRPFCGVVISHTTREEAGSGKQARRAAGMTFGTSCMAAGYMARAAYGVGVTEIPAAVAEELARLRAENARLMRMLKLSPRQAEPPDPAQAGFFEAPPGPVHKESPNDAKVAFFRALFAARADIYATRIENSRSGWKGWLPAVRGGWQRGIPHERPGTTCR